MALDFWQSCHFIKGWNIWQFFNYCMVTALFLNEKPTLPNLSHVWYHEQNNIFNTGIFDRISSNLIFQLLLASPRKYFWGCSACWVTALESLTCNTTLHINSIPIHHHVNDSALLLAMVHSKSYTLLKCTQCI